MFTRLAYGTLRSFSNKKLDGRKSDKSDISLERIQNKKSMFLVLALKKKYSLRILDLESRVDIKY